MTVSERDIEALEDLRIAVLSRVQGPCGSSTARGYANALLSRASQAFGEGNVQDAIWLSEREFAFNCKAFGLDHPYTRSSMKCLSALRKHARTRAFEAKMMSLLQLVS
jgi:hypothetical protein